MAQGAIDEAAVYPLFGLTPLDDYSYDALVMGGVTIPDFLAALVGLESATLYPGAGLSQAGLSVKELIAQVDYWLDSFNIDGEYESYAVFGDLSYDISEMFTLTGGARWTK